MMKSSMSNDVSQSADINLNITKDTIEKLDNIQIQKGKYGL